MMIRKARRQRWHGNQKPREQEARLGDPEYRLQKGKYRGVRVMDLPIEFVDWCATNMQWDWALEELNRRYCLMD